MRERITWCKVCGLPQWKDDNGPHACPPGFLTGGSTQNPTDATRSNAPSSEAAHDA